MRDKSPQLMEVLLLTIPLSLILGLLFLLLFIADQKQRRTSVRGIEHDALLPLNDGTAPSSNDSQSLTDKKINPANEN